MIFTKTKKVYFLLFISCIILIALFTYKKRGAIKEYMHEYKVSSQFSEKCDIQELNKLDIPVLVIKTKDEIEPSCEVITPPHNCGLIGVINDEYVKSTIEMHERDEKKEQKVESTKCPKTTYGKGKIKIRGNFTVLSDKKSFKLKLSQKADLIDNDDKRIDDEWVLLRMGNELKTAVGMKLNALAGFSYVPRFKYVNLVINENYRGIYILAESQKRTENNCRIDISKEGYILEFDPYWYTEELYITTAFTQKNNPFRYTFKYPSKKKVKGEYLDYITSYLNSMEYSIKDGTYEKYIDIDSWARWILCQDILGNRDGGGSNMFMYKNDKTDSTKIQMGSLWDFDCIYSNPTKSSNSHMDLFFYPLLFNSTNSSLKFAYIDYWKRNNERIFSNMENYLNDIIKDPIYVKNMNQARMLDAKRWDYKYVSVEDEIRETIKWFRNRQKWMNEVSAKRQVIL